MRQPNQECVHGKHSSYELCARVKTLPIHILKVISCDIDLNKSYNMFYY